MFIFKSCVVTNKRVKRIKKGKKALRESSRVFKVKLQIKYPRYLDGSGGTVVRAGGTYHTVPYRRYVIFFEIQKNIKHSHDLQIFPHNLTLPKFILQNEGNESYCERNE